MISRTSELLIGCIVLLAGLPLGILLKYFAGKEEIELGQPYFKGIMIISLLGAIGSLLTQQYYLTYTFTFIGIITQPSLSK